MTTLLRQSGIQYRAVRQLRVFCLGLSLLAAATPVSAQQPPAGPGPLRPGDIVVVTQSYLTDRDGGRLVKVDPSSGAETVLSDFADPSQGPIATPPQRPVPPFYAASLVVEDATAIFVNHTLFGRALLQVDPATGVRTIISDSFVSAVPPFAIEPSGDLLGVDQPALVRVNRSTGAGTIVSDFHDPAQGPVAESISGLAVEESGQITAGGLDATCNGVGLFRIEPSNGVRTLFSDFGNPAQGPAPSCSNNSFGMYLLIDHSGNILIVSQTGSVGPFVSFRLFRVDPVTGVRTFLSALNCGLIPGQFLLDVALAETGDLLVVFGGDELDPHALYRFDSTTGACGGLRGSTEAVGVVPTPLVNGMVSLSVASTVVEPPTDERSAPTGVFRIIATFTNESAIPLRDPFFRVAELSGGNMLVSGDRPPDLIRAGGKGTRQTPDVGNDGVLSPGESVAVTFRLGLQTRDPFTFFVNVFGEPDTSDGSP